MATQTKDLVVFIGRFSPFHNGHAAVLKRAMQTYKTVLVLVGSSGQARTTKNPFTFDERANMIRNFVLDTMTDSKGHLPAALRIKPIYDHPYNDQAWIRGVQDAVDQAKDEFSDIIGLNPTVYLTGADRDRSTWYLNSFGNLFKPDFVTADDHDLVLSATQVREILFSSMYPKDLQGIASMVPETTLDFLRGFWGGAIHNGLVKEYSYIENYKKMYAGLKFPVSIQTVDTCVIQSGHVLVGERINFPGQGLWCMPGGHLDVDKNERLVDAAIRELMEETRIELSKAQLYGSIKSKECFDHPDRSLKARVITMCYLLKLDDSKPLPKIRPQVGEMKRVFWLPINEGLKRRDMWFDDHHAMLETMYGRISN